MNARNRLGDPRWPWTVTIVHPAITPPRVMLNRYPGQTIGIAIRLPRTTTHLRHLIINWARPHLPYPEPRKGARR